MAFLTVCLNPTIQKTLCFPSIVPGEVNRTGDHRLDVSGKGINVTRVLTQLGKKAVHLTQLGGVMRPLFLSLCEKDGLPVEWVESNSQIRFCYTVLTENDSQTTELVEESEPVGAGTEKLLMEKFDSLLCEQSFSCLIISGTKASGFSDTLIPSMVRKAKEKGLKVILDIKGTDLIESLQYNPDIIKPNFSEFAATFTIDESARESILLGQIKSAALDINRKYGCRIILTNGSRKIFAVDSASEGSPDNFFEVDIQPVKTANTTGCGDAFTAGLASALEDSEYSGVYFCEAINEGIRCGALNACLAKPGAIF